MTDDQLKRAKKINDDIELSEYLLRLMNENGCHMAVDNIHHGRRWLPGKVSDEVQKYALSLLKAYIYELKQEFDAL